MLKQKVLRKEIASKRIPKNERDALVALDKCFGLVISAARRYHLPGRFDFEDACNEAQLVIMREAQVFDPERADFFQYVSPRVYNRLIDIIRYHQKLRRDYRREDVMDTGIHDTIPSSDASAEAVYASSDIVEETLAHMAARLPDLAMDMLRERMNPSIRMLELYQKWYSPYNWCPSCRKHSGEICAECSSCGGSLKTFKRREPGVFVIPFPVIAEYFNVSKAKVQFIFSQIRHALQDVLDEGIITPEDIGGLAHAFRT